jgi:hypothetical protein
MPIVEQAISTEIQAFIKKSQSSTFSDPDAAIKEFGDSLAKTIANAIKSATVNVQIPPATVSQGVSPAVIVNPVAIPLTGNLT